VPSPLTLSCCQPSNDFHRPGKCPRSLRRRRCSASCPDWPYCRIGTIERALVETPLLELHPTAASEPQIARPLLASTVVRQRTNRNLCCGIESGQIHSR
jgi:hypothetical protein